MRTTAGQALVAAQGIHNPRGRCGYSDYSIPVSRS